MFPPLTPAYGRDYKSKAALLADFDAGKDFRISDLMLYGLRQAYTTKEELIKAGIRKILIRYNGLRKVAVHSF